MEPNRRGRYIRLRIPLIRNYGKGDKHMQSQQFMPERLTATSEWQKPAQCEVIKSFLITAKCKSG